MLTVRGAGIDAVNVIDAAADGILLDDSETHDDRGVVIACVLISMSRLVSDGPKQ